MLSDAQWAELKAEDPGLMGRVRKDLEDLSRRRCGWAEVLRIGDAELLGMARLGTAKLEHGRAADAEMIFWALTELDPFVPWFWMALGDARWRLGKLPEASTCYDRCIHEASRMQPPAQHEVRAASLRRGRLYAHIGRATAAFEDFKRVLDLDDESVQDGQHARLALQALADQGQVPEALLQSLPALR